MKYDDNADDVNGDDAQKGWCKFAGLYRLEYHVSLQAGMSLIFS